MKSNLYVANAVSIYRQAIDHWSGTQKPASQSQVANWTQQLEMVSNRDFSTGGLLSRPSAINTHFDAYQKKTDFIGTIKSVDASTSFIEVKSPLKTGDTLSVLSPDGSTCTQTVTKLLDMSNQELSSCNANTVVKLSFEAPPALYSVLHRKIDTFL